MKNLTKESILSEKGQETNGNSSSRINAEAIKLEIENLLNSGSNNTITESTNLLVVKTANDWIDSAKKRPNPKMLYDSLWFEGELCILFADTNLGKSILAVQISESISSGVEIEGFRMNATSQGVLYLDFELSDKQFELRYSNVHGEHYGFSPNFYRVEFNPNADLPEKKTIEDILVSEIEKIIIDTKNKVVIVDNMTFLKEETEKAKDALSLMKELKRLKMNHGLSILALAHTPKRDPSRPLGKNDLQGSKMLINFCDSAFAIGESKVDKSLRYIKQIKQRNTEEIYGRDNVIVCQITKADNFLKFELIEFAPESAHLSEQSEDDKTELTEQIKEVMAETPDIKPYSIAKKLLPEQTKFGSFRIKVERIVKKLKATT